MACLQCAEAERPQHFVEAISGEQTWETFGIQIKWTEPIVPGNVRLALNEPVRLRLCVETRKNLGVPPEELTAWCWTHIHCAENPSGVWKEIKLNYSPHCTQWNDHGITSYVFQASVVPLKDEVYRLTFNVKNERVLIWANQFGVDNVVDIRVKPSVSTQTVIFPPVHFSGYFCNKIEGETPMASKSKATKELTANKQGRPEGNVTEMRVMP